MRQIDQELFERARRGEREAFWKLILPMRGLIYSVALGILKSPEQAEEQLHDVLLTACGAIANLREASRFPSWLYSMTRYRAMEWARREQHERQLIHERSIGPAAVVPVADLQDKERWLTLLEEGLGALPEPFRVILALKYINDYTCPEIAEILDTTLTAVKSRLFEARKLLRQTTSQLAEKQERAHS